MPHSTKPSDPHPEDDEDVAAAEPDPELDPGLRSDLDSERTQSGDVEPFEPEDPEAI